MRTMGDFDPLWKRNLAFVTHVLLQEDRVSGYALRAENIVYKVGSLVLRVFLCAACGFLCCVYIVILLVVGYLMV
jgi:hypothetical protein